jgi:flagellar biosynthesis/type III secretory pathway chaperone
MDSEDWQTLHNVLKEGLEKEIRLTRELLSNLHQEELSLMLHDVGSLNQVLQMRYSVLESLSSLRLIRLKTTEKIEKITPSKNKHPSLEEILPPSDPITLEILSLSDQLVALTERLHRQNTHNQKLKIHPDSSGYPQLLPQARPKRKASIATINIIK